MFTQELSKNSLLANASVEVQSFEECKAAGYLIKAGSPDQCITPEKIVFFAENQKNDDSFVKTSVEMVNAKKLFAWQKVAHVQKLQKIVKRIASSSLIVYIPNVFLIIL